MATIPGKNGSEKRLAIEKKKGLRANFKGNSGMY
jgi:hypothetical protein